MSVSSLGVSMNKAVNDPTFPQQVRLYADMQMLLQSAGMATGSAFHSVLM